MNTRYTNLFRFFFAFLDLAALNLIHIVLLFLMQHLNIAQNRYFAAEVKEEILRSYILYFMITNMVWLGCAYFTALYINDKILSFERFAKKTVQSFLLFLVIILFFIFLSKIPWYSRSFVLLSFTGFGITLILTRIFFIVGGDYLRSKQEFNKKIVILGYNDVSKKLMDRFLANNQRSWVEGYFEDYQNVHELSLFPILGRIKECIPYSIQHNITEIYSTISPEKHSYIYELAQDAEKNLIRFKFVPDLQMFVNRSIHVDYLEDIPILSLRSEPLEDIAGRIKKRFFDVLFSFFVITFILSWLLPILAILIKLDSKGPVFFTQFRPGKNNKSFRILKFRSLHQNPDGEKQVSRDDTRYTRLGKFLRKSSIDEMPQFINVLLGDMSIVGPRPQMLKQTQDFSRVLNHYMIRHFIKPGVTGWAQVNGFRGEIRNEEQLKARVAHDIWYLEHWSIWLDIRIVFLTLYTTLRGDKNAF